jgi:hypothetical protein
MMNSMRRVGVALVLSGFMFLSLGLFSMDIVQCPSVFSCLAAVSLYEPEFMATQSTPENISSEQFFNFSFTSEAVRLVSIYALLLGVVILIILEMLELRYLTFLFRNERLHHRR